MRTKTILMSALLGTLGSISVMAQSTNVYSLNAVGYINVTLAPGFNIVSCPLIASPDNTLNTLFPDTNGAYAGFQYWGWNPGTAAYTEDVALPKRWGNGGTETLNPGQAAWIDNTYSTNVTVTFVGTVPSGTNSVTLPASSFQLVSSILPTSGDIITNSLMNFTNGVAGDQVWAWSTGTQAYTEYVRLPTHWPADPIQTNVGGGFWYYNAQATNNVWTESFSVNQ